MDTCIPRGLAEAQTNRQKPTNMEVKTTLSVTVGLWVGLRDGMLGIVECFTWVDFCKQSNREPILGPFSPDLG